MERSESIVAFLILCVRFNQPGNAGIQRFCSTANGTWETWNDVFRLLKQTH